MTKISELTRPIVGMENRTAQEVFDIMADRFRQLDKEQEGGHIQPSVSQSSPQPAGVRVKGLDRYDMYANHDGERAWPSPELAAQGEWVKFVDLPTLETQEEEAVVRMEGLPDPADVQRWNDQAEIDAYNRLASAQGLAHPTPVQKEEDGQTVSEDRVERGAIALFQYDYPKDRWDRFGQKDYHPEKYRDKARAALTAALVKP